MSVLQPIAWFENRYRCSQCNAEWYDEWSCTCNDRCPQCDFEMTPVSSTDLSRKASRAEWEYAARRLPSPLFPPHVNEVVRAAWESN